MCLREQIRQAPGTDPPINGGGDWRRETLRKRSLRKPGETAALRWEALKRRKRKPRAARPGLPSVRGPADPGSRSAQHLADQCCLGKGADRLRGQGLG